MKFVLQTSLHVYYDKQAHYIQNINRVNYIYEQYIIQKCL